MKKILQKLSKSSVRMQKNRIVLKTEASASHFKDRSKGVFELLTGVYIHVYPSLNAVQATMTTPDDALKLPTGTAHDDHGF